MESFSNRINALEIPCLADVVNILIEEAIRLTNSKMSYFALVNKAEDELTMIGWSKSVMGACKVIDKPIAYKMKDTGLWGDAVRERKGVITNDYENCTRPTKKGQPKGHVEVIRHMNVPVFKEGRIVAVVGVGNKETDYTETDGINLQSFATQACEFILSSQ